MSEFDPKTGPERNWIFWIKTYKTDMLLTRTLGSTHAVWGRPEGSKIGVQNGVPF